MPAFTFRPGATPALAFQLHDSEFPASASNPPTFGAAPVVVGGTIAAGRQLVVWGLKRLTAAALARKALENVVKKGISGHSGQDTSAAERYQAFIAHEMLYAFSELGLMIAFGSPQWLADPPAAPRESEVIGDSA